MMRPRACSGTMTSAPNSIERAAHERALRRIDACGEIAAADQVRVQFEPADQRIALAVFELVRFRQAAQAGAQADNGRPAGSWKKCRRARRRRRRPRFRPDWRAGPRRCRTGERRAENAAAALSDARVARATLRCARAAPAHGTRARCSRSSRFSCSTRRCSKPRDDQRLKPAPIDLQILRGIDAGLFRFAQRLGARSCRAR